MLSNDGKYFIIPWDSLKPVDVKIKERYEKPSKQVYVTKPARLFFFSVKLFYRFCHHATEILPVHDLYDFFQHITSMRLTIILCSHVIHN